MSDDLIVEMCCIIVRALFDALLCLDLLELGCVCCYCEVD